MAEQAQVRSVEAIQSFRSALIVYLNKARPTIEEICGDVVRTRLWLQNDQRRHWDREARLRSRKLEEAQARLLSARLSNLRSATSLEQMTVQRAQHALREADEKLAVIRKWDQELENRTDPLVKELEQLQGFLCGDLTRAVAYLELATKALEAYADATLGTAVTGTTTEQEHT